MKYNNLKFQAVTVASVMGEQVYFIWSTSFKCPQMIAGVNSLEGGIFNILITKTKKY